MNRIFCYLDRFYTNVKCKKPLAKISMDLYKSNFFEAFKEDIFIAVDKLINEERNGSGTEESKAKIKSIKKILDEMNSQRLSIKKEKEKIIWINENKDGDLPESELKNLWVNEYFINDTEKFIKNKATSDFQKMTIPEYLSSQLKYLEEEKERLNEYIDPRYHEKINAVNYQYLFGQFKEKFQITDEMVAKDSEKQENSQLEIIQKYQNYIIQSTLTKIMKSTV